MSVLENILHNSPKDRTDVVSILLMEKMFDNEIWH
jgi:hypothetical protein